MRAKLLIVTCVACLVSGCGLKKMTTRTVGAISFEGAAVLESEQDVEIARESTLPLIKSLEVFSAGDPNDKRYLALLAKSYGQYAFGFFEEDMIRYRGRDEVEYQKSLKRADSFYDRGKNYGLRALGPEEKIEARIKRSSKKDLPTLFWTAFCWGNWLNLHKDDPIAIVDLPRIQSMAERVVEMDPSYVHGSALSFLGALHASRPPMLGGDPQKAREYFERATDSAPNYLMNKVMMAQFLAVQTQDRAMFERLLREVRSSDAAALPQQRLANELAKRRAALLLERANDYF